MAGGKGKGQSFRPLPAMRQDAARIMNEFLSRGCRGFQTVFFRRSGRFWIRHVALRHGTMYGKQEGGSARERLPGAGRARQK